MSEIELYQCRSCGTVSGSTPAGGCPNCNNHRGPEVETGSLDPDKDSVTKRKPWYKTIVIEGEIHDW